MPPPPVPLMSITVQPASGKPRVIVMDEAGLAALIMDAADALAAMAAASAVLAPAGEHPYPEPLPRREPGRWSRLRCGCTVPGGGTPGIAAWCSRHGDTAVTETGPDLAAAQDAELARADGGEPPAPAELTEDEARQPCDRKACGHERGHHAKGTEECAHGCGCAAYLLPMPAPAAATETEDAP